MTGYALHVQVTEAAIGAKALYLLFIWLISAATASWMTGRKGYSERLGLTMGLLLSALGLLIVLLLPGRPGSKWRVEGRLPRRRRRVEAVGPEPGGAPGRPDRDQRAGPAT